MAITWAAGRPFSHVWHTCFLYGSTRHFHVSTVYIMQDPTIIGHFFQLREKFAQHLKHIRQIYYLKINETYHSIIF